MITIVICPVYNIKNNYQRQIKSGQFKKAITSTVLFRRYIPILCRINVFNLPNRCKCDKPSSTIPIKFDAKRV